MSGLRAAFGLLTRVPAGRVVEADLAGSIPWMPVVGGVIGLLVGLGYYVALLAIPSLPAACLAVALGTLLTGAFHEDGLADFADGFGGGADREGVIRIMREPTLGTYGVLALVLSFALRATALAAVAGGTALLILPAAHAMSRGAAVGVIGSIPAATSDGVASSYGGTAAQIAGGILAALGVALLALGWWTGAFAALALIVALVIARWARTRIDGYTGDVLGAVEQVTEVGLLLMGAALASAGLISDPWWAWWD